MQSFVSTRTVVHPGSRVALAALLALGTLVLAAPASRAQIDPNAIVARTEHVDIGVGFGDGALDLHIHSDPVPLTNDPADTGEYSTNEVLLHVADGGFTRPAGDAFNFIGVPAGAPILVLPQNQAAGILFLGFGGEELPLGTFVNNTVTLSLVSVVGPGQFSVYTSSDSGPIRRMATSDGIGADDFLNVLAGSHAHHNLVFTAGGYYAVTFTATGTLTAGGTVTDTQTYYFGAGTGNDNPAAAAAALNNAAAPEPGSLALIGFVGAGALGTAVRRRRVALAA